jgi:hypothetical protein
MIEARPVLRLGDRVSFGGEEHLVAGLAGTSVRLRANSGVEQVVLAGHLMSAPDFAVLDAAGLPAVEPFGLLESLPAEVVADAERWRDHLVEINIGSVMRFIPFGWPHSSTRATQPPWLHPHYQASRAGPPAFLATGTQPLTVSAAWSTPSRRHPWRQFRGDTFTPSIREPRPGSCCLYTGHYLGSKRVTPRLIPRYGADPGFDVDLKGFRRVTDRHLQPFSRTAPDVLMADNARVGQRIGVNLGDLRANWTGEDR